MGNYRDHVAKVNAESSWSIFLEESCKDLSLSVLISIYCCLVGKHIQSLLVGKTGWGTETSHCSGLTEVL